MSREMEGISPEVESACLAGAWARVRVVENEITGAGRLCGTQKRAYTSLNLCWAATETCILKTI